MMRLSSKVFLLCLAISSAQAATIFNSIGLLSSTPTAGTDPDALGGNIVQILGQLSTPGTLDLTCDGAGTCSRFTPDFLFLLVGANAYAVTTPLVLLDAAPVGDQMFQLTGSTTIGADLISFASSAFLPAGTVPGGLQTSFPPFASTAMDLSVSFLVYGGNSGLGVLPYSLGAVQATSSATPEPATWGLTVTALLGLFSLRVSAKRRSLQRN